MPINLDFTNVLISNPADGRRKLGIEDFDLGAHDTDELPQGIKNLYWSQLLFNAAFAKAISKLPPSPAPTPIDFNALFDARFASAFPVAFQAAFSALFNAIDGDQYGDDDSLDGNTYDQTLILDGGSP